MKEIIASLYKKVRDISVEYLYYQKTNNCEKIVEIIPQIQEFVEWFMNGNIFDIGEELYAGLCNGLVDILKDIVSAIDQKDAVLLNDAIAYGLIEYLKMFLDEEEYTDDEI